MAIDPAELKRIVGERAAEIPENGMTIGLGSGSTAGALVHALSRRIERGELRDVRFVSTSENTTRLAESLGMRVESLDEVGAIDLTIDGADEIDPDLRLIKGLGGALLREKIVAQASRRMLVIADHTKRVKTLGRGVLPVEVVPFGFDRLQNRLRDLGYEISIRGGESPFVTDEGNRILDLEVPENVDVGELHDQLDQIAGVVETGYFGHEATRALIGEPDGSITDLDRR